LRNPKGSIIDGQIIVRDGFMLSTFSDPNLANQLYRYDREQGEDVAFNEKHNAYIKKYPDMKKAKILEEVKKGLTKAGGEIIKIK